MSYYLLQVVSYNSVWYVCVWERLIVCVCVSVDNMDFVKVISSLVPFTCPETLKLVNATVCTQN